MPRLRRRRKTPSSPPPSPDSQGEMTLLDHLEELRRRLIVCLIAVVVTTAISFIFVDELMALLLQLLASAPGVTVQAIEIPEKFTTSMRLALTSGIAMSMPVIVYQLWRFLRPGLYPNEQRYVLAGLPLVIVFFVGGVLFSYYVALPPALGFLLGFGNEEIVTQPRLQTYLSFVSTLIFWSGVSFETPIILFFLAKVGVVDKHKLSRWRRYAMLVVALLAAVITPTPDPLNMMIVAVPLYLLYELGVLLSRLA